MYATPMLFKNELLEQSLVAAGTTFPTELSTRDTIKGDNSKAAAL